MKRSDREITDRVEIDEIISSSQVMRLGLCDDGVPYVVPLCFGYDGDALYFHCGPEGRKLDIIRKNNQVCFEFDSVVEVVEAEQACGWSMKYRSVIGNGTASVLEDSAAKKAALDLIMSQYSEGSFTYPQQMLCRTTVVRIAIGSITGKQS